MSKITISMPTETVQALYQNHFQLYGFKAVKTNQRGAPLVWFTGPYSLTTLIEWDEAYQAYTTFDMDLQPGVQVRAQFIADIRPGQTLNVAQDGTGTVVHSGTSGAVSIFNTSSRQWTTGVSQNVGRPGLFCAFPLFPNFLDAIVLVDHVVLLFSTANMEPGTVIGPSPTLTQQVNEASSPGIFIDCTGASERAVSFDITRGWSWGETAWARSIPANTNLVPILIQPA
jgi:hypothetical protein